MEETAENQYFSYLLMMINCRHKNFPSLLLTGIKENYCLMCLDSKSFGGAGTPSTWPVSHLGAGSLQPILNTQEAEFSQIPGNQNHALGHLASVLQPDCLLVNLNFLASGPRRGTHTLHTTCFLSAGPRAWPWRLSGLGLPCQLCLPGKAGILSSSAQLKIITIHLL